MSPIMRSEHVLVNSVTTRNYILLRFTQKIIPAETNYDIHDKKLLIIMIAL
jgi:hypothetical protein